MNLHVLIFMLLNISGAQDVQTVSHLSVQQGKSIIIPCWYNPIYVHNVKYVSFRHSWFVRQQVIRSNKQSIHKTISISDNKMLNIFTVEIRSVRKEDAGKYWSAIDLRGVDVGREILLEVTTGISGLYVENQMLTGFESGSVTIYCHHHPPSKKDEMWCKLGGNCVTGKSGSLDGASVGIRYSSGLMTVTMSNLKKENTGWYWCHARKLQIPVHITVSARIETITSATTEITFEQKSSSTLQFLQTFTSLPQTLSHRKTPVLLWLVIFLVICVLMVIFSCTALILCKRKQKGTRNSSLKKKSNNDTEETHFRLCERQPTQTPQATLDQHELIYATVSFKKH